MRARRGEGGLSRPWASAGPNRMASPEDLEQVSDRDAQPGGDPLDVDEAEVALAALDAAHVGVVQPGPLGQFFLRDP